MKTEKTVGKVEIIQDGDVIHFIPVQDEVKEDVSLFRTIVNWFRDRKVTPYAKIRDAGDPFGDRTDPDEKGGGNIGVEGGIKIRF